MKLSRPKSKLGLILSGLYIFISIYLIMLILSSEHQLTDMTGLALVIVIGLWSFPSTLLLVIILAIIDHLKFVLSDSTNISNLGTNLILLAPFLNALLIYKLVSFIEKIYRKNKKT